MKIASVAITLAVAAVTLSKADGKGGKGDECNQGVVSADEDMDEDEDKTSPIAKLKGDKVAPLPLKRPEQLHKRAKKFKSSRVKGKTVKTLSDLFPIEFQSIDGMGNNIEKPGWGAAGIQFMRMTDHAYGESEQSGDNMPAARSVSVACMNQDMETQSGNELGVTEFSWIWGQFIDHDLDLTGTIDETMNIECPEDDPVFKNVTIPFKRSFFQRGDDGAREQVNDITAHCDGSVVYGVDDDRAEWLRGENGTLKVDTSGKCGPLMPKNVDEFANAQNPHRPKSDFFLCGDVRCNEHPSLIAMHTLFVREHNYWAHKIGACDSTLDSDEVYQMARFIVACEIQRITYEEFLPNMIGEEATPKCDSYDQSVNPSITNEFATVAFRMGHSQVNQETPRMDMCSDGVYEPLEKGPLDMVEAFFSPEHLEEDCLEPYLRGAAITECEDVDLKLVPNLQNMLFAGHTTHGLDLAALNMQRGRDHGMCDYSSMCEGYGLAKVESFDDYPGATKETTEELRKLYGTPDKMHAWIGLLGEKHVPGAMVGECMQEMIREQFERVCVGDRFFYEHYLRKDYPQLYRMIKGTYLSDIIVRNTDICEGEIQKEVFRMPDDGWECQCKEEDPKKSNTAFQERYCDIESPTEMMLDDLPIETRASVADTQPKPKKATKKGLRDRKGGK